MTPSIRLRNGTYTISSPGGEHRTIRVRNEVWGGRPAEAGKAGAQGVEKRVVALLTGPNNEDDRSYTGFAFVTETGIAVWTSRRGDGVAFFGGRFPMYPSPAQLPPRASEYQRLAAALADMAWDGGRHSVLASRGFRIQCAATCLRCGRTLTTPESIDAGIGPECERLRGEGK